MAQIQTDIPYAHDGERPLMLDVYRPDGPGNGVAVVMLHGGGWRRGSKAVLAPHAQFLADRGFTAVAAEYRLAGEAPFPTQIHDVRRALRWVRAHAADLDIDPDRLCLEGHSAGGHLALLAAASGNDPALDPPEGGGGVSAAVAAVVAVYPPTLFRFDPDERSMGSVPAGALPGADASPDMAALASPVSHVTAAHPPVMLLHGDADQVVPVDASRRYDQEIRKVGGQVDLHIFGGLPHGFGNHEEFRPVMMQMIVDYLRRVVVDPAAFTMGPSRFERALAQA